MGVAGGRGAGAAFVGAVGAGFAVLSAETGAVGFGVGEEVRACAVEVGVLECWLGEGGFAEGFFFFHLLLRSVDAEDG